MLDKNQVKQKLEYEFKMKIANSLLEKGLISIQEAQEFKKLVKERSR